MSSEDDIDALASDIARKALKEDVKISEQIEALKVLTAYHAVKLKHRSPAVDESSDMTFDHLVAQVEETRDGRTTPSAGVSARRRPSRRERESN